MEDNAQERRKVPTRSTHDLFLLVLPFGVLIPNRLHVLTTKPHSYDTSDAESKIIFTWCGIILIKIESNQCVVPTVCRLS